MSFETLGEHSLDYLPCRYGNSKLLFRGPRRDLSAPYVAFLGGTETYGKFVRTPFVGLVETSIGTPCVNFGCLNAGVDVFLNDPFLPDAANRASVTVLQVPSAANVSNRLYSVHPRRNDRFVAPAKTLSTIFPDVDFARFTFNKHMLSHLRELSPERYSIVAAELSDAWVARMKSLMTRISGPLVLLWISDRAPEDGAAAEREPLHVHRGMIDEVVENAITYVEVVLSDEARDAGTEGMVFRETEAPVAKEVIGLKAHEEVAGKLADALRELQG